MSTRLVNLSGPHQQGFDFKYDPTDVNNFEAGMLFLTLINDIFTQHNSLGTHNWFHKYVSGPVGDVIDYVGDKTSDIIDYGGDKLGDAIRLLTDEEVVEGVKTYGEAYVTGGASFAYDSAGNPLDQQIQQNGFSIEDIGKIFKDAVAKGQSTLGLSQNQMLMVGGLGLLAVIMVVKK